MEEYKKVWKEMEELGWSNIPEGFHLEYFKDIIEATKTALMTSQKSDLDHMFKTDYWMSLPGGPKITNKKS